MVQKVGGEGTSPTPDRYFHNEMKREVADIVRTDSALEMATAEAMYVNFDDLGSLLAAGDISSPYEWASLRNSAKAENRELWGYLNACFQEAQRSHGYDGKDFRGLAVNLSAACIRVARIVDFVKVRELGAAADTGFANAVTTSIFMNAANSLVANNQELITPGAIGFVAKLADDSFNKTSYTAGHESWSWAKVHTFAEALEYSLMARQILSELPEISDADAEMLRRQNASYAEATNSMSTYTPKPAVGLLEGTDTRTLVIDRDISKHFVVLPAADQTVVTLFKGTELDSSNSSLQYSRAYKDIGGMTKRIITEDITALTPRLQTLLYKNRDLTFNGVYLEDFARDLGLQNQAVLLTSMLLIQNFDLTVPAYIVDVANQEAANIKVTPELSPVADRLRRLSIARTRVLRILGEDLDEEMQKEIAETEKTHKDMIKHGVVGHLRRLPRGYKAGEGAKKLCLEQLGVEIPDGHTYVQKHNRGNLELPHKGHAIVPEKAAGYRTT